METLPLDDADLQQIIANTIEEATALEKRTQAVESLITKEEADTLFDDKPTFLYARTLSLNSEVWAKESQPEKATDSQANHIAEETDNKHKDENKLDKVPYKRAICLNHWSS